VSRQPVAVGCDAPTGVTDEPEPRHTSTEHDLSHINPIHTLRGGPAGGPVGLRLMLDVSMSGDP
jgi:hypothetical protein